MSNYEELPPRRELPSALPGRKRFNFTNNRFASTAPQPELASEEIVYPPSPFHNHERDTRRKVRQQNRAANRLENKSGDLVFNVAQLLRDPEGTTRSYDVETDKMVLSEEGGEIASNISGYVRFTRVRHEILVQGEFETDATISCVRCLNEFTIQNLQVDLEEQFRPSIDVVSGLPVAAEETEEGHLLIDENHLLDLGEALRQQILVSLPMLPLCSEDCPGLYQYLEQINADVENLPDEEDEEEPDVPADPRWANLVKFRPEK